MSSFDQPQRGVLQISKHDPTTGWIFAASGKSRYFTWLENNGLVELSNGRIKFGPKIKKAQLVSGSLVAYTLIRQSNGGFRTKRFGLLEVGGEADLLLRSQEQEYAS